MLAAIEIRGAGRKEVRRNKTKSRSLNTIGDHSFQPTPAGAVGSWIISEVNAAPSIRFDCPSVKIRRFPNAVGPNRIGSYRSGRIALADQSLYSNAGNDQVHIERSRRHCRCVMDFECVWAIS
jgi:hypothetical protein